MSLSPAMYSPEDSALVSWTSEQLSSMNSKRLRSFRMDASYNEIGDSAGEDGGGVRTLGNSDSCLSSENPCTALWTKEPSGVKGAE